MGRTDWNIRNADIHDSFEEVKDLHYRDLENFDNELKEQEILEFEKDDKRHLIELGKLKNARKELELE